MNAAHRSRGRVALGLTAAAVGLGLALTGGHPVEPTVAESQDTEYVKTTGQGYWPTYYANIVAGSAKSSVPATNTQNLRYIENLRFSPVWKCINNFLLVNNFVVNTFKVKTKTTILGFHPITHNATYP